MLSGYREFDIIFFFRLLSILFAFQRFEEMDLFQKSESDSKSRILSVAFLVWPRRILPYI